jgi:hypothetical protein
MARMAAAAAAAATAATATTAPATAAVVVRRVRVVIILQQILEFHFNCILATFSWNIIPSLISSDVNA